MLFIHTHTHTHEHAQNIHRKDILDVKSALSSSWHKHFAMYRRHGIAKKPFLFIDNEITYFLICEGEQFLCTLYTDIDIDIDAYIHNII